MLTDVIKHTIMITSFVMVMMLIIEFINVQTKGKFSTAVQKSTHTQVLMAVLLGIIPGCMGVFALVSLYTHNLIRFGALVAAMIATFGDEAFIMFSAAPQKALILSGVLIVTALFSGYAINFFLKKKSFSPSYRHFEIHQEHEQTFLLKWATIRNNLHKPTFERAIILFGLLTFIFLLLTGTIGHGHGTIDHHGEWGWIRITFLLSSIIAFTIVSVVSNHFLHEHIWEHIIKKHFIKIFLWILGTMIVIHLLMEQLDLESWIRDNNLLVLLLAILVGIIPTSGPHLLFINLFLTGNIPFSILLANSIVQEGHGGLPLLAESKRSFIYLKIIKIIIACIIGIAGFLINF
jgi:hypothetical protein